MNTFLLVFDKASLTYLRPGVPPRTCFSHDQNMFQLAHAALKRGHRVFVCDQDAVWGGECREIVEIYPLLLIRHRAISIELAKPDVVVNVHPQLLRYGILNNAKKVAIHPALYFVEMPYTYHAKQTADLFRSISRDADFIVVQNNRMKEFVGAIYEWMIGWTQHDRILVCPLGIDPDAMIERHDRQEARSRYGIAPDGLAIVNAGGVWNWTDFDNFLEGFVKAYRSGATNLKLFLSGLRQAENSDHGDFIARVQRILEANSDMTSAAQSNISGRAAIRLQDDWEAGTKELPWMLSAGDLGLNVSKAGLENWQSHRVRLLDYAKYDLPVFCTTGDSFADEWGWDCCIAVRDRTPEAYAGALMSIHANREHLARLRLHAPELKLRVNSEINFGRVVDTIVSCERRNHSRDREGTIELARTMAKNRLQERVKSLWPSDLV
jgi:hypothetical protein